MGRLLVMGILNVTPDSFFDGGRYLDEKAAISHGKELLDQGADIVDVGGESTRPGATPIGEEEELRRVLPVIEALGKDERVTDGRARISVDTTRPAVAAAGLKAGATILNDVSSSLAELAARADAAYVAMHRKGSPADMQDDPRYDDVVGEVSEYLREKATAAEASGVGEVWIDPGIGFGKTARHNLALLASLGELASLGWPVLVGTSRKAFLGRLAAGGPEEPPLGTEERFEGSLATAAWAMACGAAGVRVHDVRATVEAARLATMAGFAGTAP